MKAGILAAGTGSRFVEAGELRPKPLIRVGGRPLVAIVLDNLFATGIEGVEILLNGEPRFDPVESYLEQRPEAERIRTWRKSTASSFESFCFLLERLGDPPFLLTTVDTVFTQEDLAALLRLDAYPAGCGLVLAVTDLVHDTNPLWVEVAPDGRIERMGPSVVERRDVTAGLYLVLADLGAEQKTREYTALRFFLTALVEDGTDVRARRFRSVLDIDCPEDIRVASSVLGSGAQSPA